VSETDVRHSIKVVSRRTGLSPHVIRVWEKRYATIQPQRSNGNQRLYSEAEVERLALLKQIVDAGHNIGTVARLSTEQLRSLAAESAAPAAISTSARAASLLKSRTVHEARPAGEFVQAAFAAVKEMDAVALEQVLDEASVSLGQMALLNQVISPLVQQVGAAWREGTIKVAHEHLASAVIRTFLGHVARPLALHGTAPTILVTTPAGQLHELGAVLAAACAAAHGWRVTYLGPSLPADEIVSAAKQREVRAVALSLVHPEDDPGLAAELKRLRRLLPQNVSLLVGGRAAGAYRGALSDIGATVCENLNDLATALDRLRQGRN